MKTILLWILRKHWVKPTRKANSIRFLNLDGKNLRLKLPTRKITIYRDFSELYFFPSIAAKLVKPPSLEVTITVEPSKEQMFFTK